LFPAGTARARRTPDSEYLDQLIEALEAEATEERAELDEAAQRTSENPNMPNTLARGRESACTADDGDVGFGGVGKNHRLR